MKYALQGQTPGNMSEGQTLGMAHGQGDSEGGLQGYVGMRLVGRQFLGEKCRPRMAKVEIGEVIGRAGQSSSVR